MLERGHLDRRRIANMFNLLRANDLSHPPPGYAPGSYVLEK
jgi:hypothetical protein